MLDFRKPVEAFIDGKWMDVIAVSVRNQRSVTFGITRVRDIRNKVDPLQKERDLVARFKNEANLKRPQGIGEQAYELDRLIELAEAGLEWLENGGNKP